MMRFCLSFLLVSATAAWAGSINVTSSGLSVDGSLQDQQWSLASAPAGYSTPLRQTQVGTNNFPFFGTQGETLWNRQGFAASRWISPTANYGTGTNGDAPGSYIFQTTFDIADGTINAVDLAFRIMVDNNLNDVLLNGQSLGFQYLQSNPNDMTPFQVFSPVMSILNPSLFRNGTNTLSFVVWNTPPSWVAFRSAPFAYNPVGLRVEFTSQFIDVTPPVDPVPEPATWITMAAAFSALALYQKRKSALSWKLAAVQRHPRLACRQPLADRAAVRGTR